MTDDASDSTPSVVVGLEVALQEQSVLTRNWQEIAGTEMKANAKLKRQLEAARQGLAWYAREQNHIPFLDSKIRYDRGQVAKGAIEEVERIEKED